MLSVVFRDITKKKLLQKIMKKLSILILLICLVACQTKQVTQSNVPKEQSGKPIEEKSFIELGGERQYVEITGSSDLW